MTPLNRRQPVDPAFLISWVVGLAGDGSGGTATNIATVDANIAAVPLFMSADNDNGDLDCAFLGQTDAGTTFIVDHKDVLVAIGGVTRFNWDIPKSLVVPTLGGQITFRAITANPGVGQTLLFFGRLLGWPRNEVIGLPYTFFWPYVV